MNTALPSIDIDRFPTEALDGSPSFAGNLNKYLYDSPDYEDHSLSSGWAESTLGNYIKDYNNIVLPALSDLNNKPIRDYTEDDLFTVLDRLRKRNVSGGRMGHFAYLLWIVYRAGVRAGAYEDNIMWDGISDDDFTDDPVNFEKNRSENLVRNKKSFDLKTEQRVFDRLTEADMGETLGQEIGMLIMEFTAARNNEAAALNFGDFSHLREHDKTYCQKIYKTVKLESEELKAGGKTINAPRTLPVPDILSDIIFRRREYLQKKIDRGELVLTDEFKSVDDLPIVCRDHDYLRRCTSRDLTKFGLKLFRELKLTREENPIRGAREDIVNTDLRQYEPEEKDPTTYISRRNMGTHLYTLGLSLPQIQYYMGHDIDDPAYKRSDFENSDKLYEIACMIQKHPLNTEENRKKVR